MNERDNHEPFGGAGAPAIILVEPQLGENIGTAARAMANFGLTDLRLVTPRDGWPSESARAAASRADHVIDAATVFDSVEEAIASLNLVFATTARMREMNKPVNGPQEAATRLRACAASNVRTGILFGRERWGLTNEEVTLADEIITFPVNPDFASLNIAQSVLLMSYEWLSAGLDGALPTRFPITGLDEPPAEKADLIRLFDHLESALDDAGFIRSEGMRPVIQANIRGIFQKASMTAQEVQTMRGMVAALERRHERPSERARRKRPGPAVEHAAERLDKG